MPQHSPVSEFFSGQGNVLQSAIDAAGIPTGYILLGEVSDLTISNAIQSFDKRGNIDGQRAIVLRLTQSQDINVALTIDSFSTENINLALYGSSTDEVAGTADILVTPPIILGAVYPMNKVNVSTVLVKDNPTKLITYEVDKNYALDEAAGSIRIFTAAEQVAASPISTIAASDVLELTFDSVAQTIIQAQTQPRPVIALRFEGLNTAKGNEPVVIDIFRFNTDPLAEFAVVNDETWQGELNGLLLSDPTKLTGSKFYTVRKLQS